MHRGSTVSQSVSQSATSCRKNLRCSGDKMVSQRWFRWISEPGPSMGSVKQDQDRTSGRLRTRKPAACPHRCPVLCLTALCVSLLLSCVALSVLYHSDSGSPAAWRRLLFDYQNISDSCLTLTGSNSHLRGENEELKQQNLWLHEQNDVLNKTSAGLVSVNAALTSQSSELTERVGNLTSANLQLTREHEQLVRFTSELEEERLNASDAIRRLSGFKAQQEEDRRRLSQLNGLLRDELLQTRQENQEIRNRFQEEFKQLQDQNQNLSRELVQQRQEAAEQQRSSLKEMQLMEADLNATKEAYRSLDLYCPVVNHNTEERVCRKCPHSWKLFQNNCYYFSSRTLTWSSSRAWCQTQGGDLLIVNSQPEQIFVFESSRALQHSSSSRLWIGLTDAEVEGQWVWVDSSEVSKDLRFWLSRPETGTEPDDWKQEDPHGEDCGHIDTSEDPLRSWMDGSCQTPYRWICEKNL